MQLVDIKKLADLARIDMSDEELTGIAKDFDAILAYVGQVQEVSKLSKIEALHENPDNYFFKNRMREDLVTNEKLEYTEKILNDAPETVDGYLKVKQIL
jgi:aspartyl-tRNA(Asn)/glutamyl-tRNA(Gln) amidotransferase subunit C